MSDRCHELPAHDDAAPRRRNSILSRKAKPSRRGLIKPLMEFNDDCAIRDLISRARSLVQAALDTQPLLGLLPLRAWKRPAIAEADWAVVMLDPECVELAQLQSADKRKLRLLADIDFERMARAAKGDLCPLTFCAPSHQARIGLPKSPPLPPMTNPSQTVRSSSQRWHNRRAGPLQVLCDQQAAPAQAANRVIVVHTVT
jgi:hypothetical protein